jgi:hypothetical protein
MLCISNTKRQERRKTSYRRKGNIPLKLTDRVREREREREKRENQGAVGVGGKVGKK